MAILFLIPLICFSCKVHAFLISWGLLLIGSMIIQFLILHVLVIPQNAFEQALLVDKGHQIYVIRFDKHSFC